MALIPSNDPNINPLTGERLGVQRLAGQSRVFTLTSNDRSQNALAICDEVLKELLPFQREAVLAYLQKVVHA